METCCCSRVCGCSCAAMFLHSVVKIRTGNCVSFRSGERAFHSSPSHFNLQRKSWFLALVCSYYWFSWRRHDHKAWFGHFFMVFTFTGCCSFLLCDINYNFTKFQKFCFECDFVFIFSNICSSWCDRISFDFN